jgi:hypothetical protein
MKKTFSEYTNAAETNGADTPTNEQPTNQGAKNMFTITSEVAVLIQSGASKEKAARAAKRKAIDLIVAQGGRGHHFTKDAVKDGLIAKETLQGIQGLIAKGLLEPADFALWSMDSKLAASKGLQKERNEFTSDVNSYLTSFRNMIETAWKKAYPEEAAAEADAKKTEADDEDDLENEKSGLESAPSAKTLTLETLQKFVIDLTLEVSASKNQAITNRRAELITALNLLEAACK